MIKYYMEVYQCCSNVIRNIISIKITYFKYFNNTVFMMVLASVLWFFLEHNWNKRGFQLVKLCYIQTVTFNLTWVVVCDHIMQEHEINIFRVSQKDLVLLLRYSLYVQQWAGPVVVASYRKKKFHYWTGKTEIVWVWLLWRRCTITQELGGKLKIKCSN